MSTRSRKNRRYGRRQVERGRQLLQLHAELKAADTDVERRRICHEVHVLLAGGERS
jgi:hypothetical protein